MWGQVTAHSSKWGRRPALLLLPSLSGIETRVLPQGAVLQVGTGPARGRPGEGTRRVCPEAQHRGSVPGPSMLTVGLLGFPASEASGSPLVDGVPTAPISGSRREGGPSGRLAQGRPGGWLWLKAAQGLPPRRRRTRPRLPALGSCRQPRQ